MTSTIGWLWAGSGFPRSARTAGAVLLAVTMSGSLSGCAGAAAGTVATAAVTTAVAVGAAGISRASGGCYASCPVGTRCNESSGLCDPIPCRGTCASNERCDQTGVFERCVPGVVVDLKIDTPNPAPQLERERLTPR
jgi:hypothetical protein